MINESIIKTLFDPTKSIHNFRIRVSFTSQFCSWLENVILQFTPSLDHILQLYASLMVVLPILLVIICLLHMKSLWFFLWLKLLWRQTLGRICGLGRGKPEEEVETVAASQSAKVGDLAFTFYLAIFFAWTWQYSFAWTWQYFFYLDLTISFWPCHQILHPILGGKHKEYFW